MSETFDRWTNAKSQLQAAQMQINAVKKVLSEIYGELDSWSKLRPGDTNTIMIPNFSNCPTAQQLAEAAAKLNSALHAEFNAYNAMPPEERTNISR